MAADVVEMLQSELPYQAWYVKFNSMKKDFNQTIVILYNLEWLHFRFNRFIRTSVLHIHS